MGGEDDEFGAALAWGDFDGDGFGDLAVGAPFLGVTPNNARTGEVVVYDGSATGLRVVGRQFLTEARYGGDGEQGDRFGQSLAGGDFNNDRISDLAIGIPRKDVPGADTQGGGTIADAGAVLVVFGRRDTGLGDGTTRSFDETDLFTLARLNGLSQPGDFFGSALATGDFDGDQRDDLAVGAARRDARGLGDSGAVFAVHSNRSALVGRIQLWDQTALFGSDATNQSGSPTETGDLFGFALAGGDFNRDGRDDLAIGAPFEEVFLNRGGGRFENVANAGEVNVIYGSAAGLSKTGRAPQQWHQNTINIEDSAEDGDGFGFSLSAWDFGKNEIRRVCNPDFCTDAPVRATDLAVGVPFENVGSVSDAGAVNVIYGVRSVVNGLSAAGDQLWTQGSPGVPGASEANDQFGSGLY